MNNVVAVFSFLMCVCVCVCFQLKSRWFVIRCVRSQVAGVLAQNSVSHANTSAEEGHVSSPVTYIMGEYVRKQIIYGVTLLMYTAFLFKNFCLLALLFLKPL